MHSFTRARSSRAGRRTPSLRGQVRADRVRVARSLKHVAHDVDELADVLTPADSEAAETRNAITTRFTCRTLRQLISTSVSTSVGRLYRGVVDVKALSRVVGVGLVFVGLSARADSLPIVNLVPDTPGTNALVQDSKFQAGTSFNIQ